VHIARFGPRNNLVLRRKSFGNRGKRGNFFFFLREYHIRNKNESLRKESLKKRTLSSACTNNLRRDSWPMMLAAATLYWSQSTGVHRQPVADHCRLSCPSCGRSYKYRSGLRGHIAECLSEREKLEADFRQRQQQQRQQLQEQQARLYGRQQQQQQQQQPVTVKDVRALYKFWKS